jgi:hypothetical protein
VAAVLRELDFPLPEQRSRLTRDARINLVALRRDPRMAAPFERSALTPASALRHQRLDHTARQVSPLTADPRKRSARCTRLALLATQNGKKVHLLAALSAPRISGIKTNGEGLNRPSRWCDAKSRCSKGSRCSNQRTVHEKSQVAQEVQYILLVGCTEHIELSDDSVGFRAAASMLLDGR